MNNRHRILLRAATHIQQVYLERRVSADEILMPQMDWEECQRLVQYLAETQRRAWPSARQRLHACLERSIRQLQGALETTYQQLTEPRPRSVPSLRQIFDELRALDTEFTDVEIALRASTVTVTTEPITLEGVYLGAFGIELDWQQLGDSTPYSKPYCIRALDEQPAASNSEVTHPHVDGGELCEGEGHAAIRGALAEGRLVDFFIVVRQILNTYNSSSAFVSLDSWHSTGCDDCGGSIDGDGYSCDGCSSYVCYECSAECCACGSCYCNQCSAKCYGCRQWHCKDCLRECAVCSEDFCKECLSHEECCECREDEVADESRSDAGTEIQRLRMGQVAVPT